MKTNKVIKVLVETVFGNVMTSAETSSENDRLLVSMLNDDFGKLKYMHIDITDVVSNDIEQFKELNSRSDESHQIDIDTLTVYEMKISGNYVRVMYWFDQFGDDSCHRMCAGVLTHFRGNPKLNDDMEWESRVFNECYSSDVCVYW